MKAKIAYIELDTHAEIAGNFMELMKDSSEFSVDYFFSEKILKIFGLQEGGNIFKTNHRTIFSQLQSQNYHQVILGTVHRYFNIFEKITNCFATTIICHNLNFVNAGNFQLGSNLLKKEVSFRLKLLLKEGLLRKNKVYEKAKRLWVLDENLADKKFHFLPLFFTKKSEKIQNEIFTIVVPGTVSQQRKDYKAIVRKLTQYQGNHRYKIVFLGKASGQELIEIENLKKQRGDYLSVEYFTEKLPYSKFDELMRSADILWCPVQEKNEFLGIEECYGKTKMSGNIGDAIAYAKIAVFPKSYEGKYAFVVPEIVLFEKKSLLKSYDAHIAEFFEEYTKEKVRYRLENTLKSFIFAESNGTV